MADQEAIRPNDVSETGGGRMTASQQQEIEQLLNQAKGLAKRYRALTGKPLGITGEVAEFYAAKHLGLWLSPAREPNYDAIMQKGNSEFKLRVGAFLRKRSLVNA